MTHHFITAYLGFFGEHEKLSVLLSGLYFYPPLPGHLVVGIVVTADAQAKELAGSALDLEPLDL